MSEERAGEAVVASIGFAERWLDRARRQVAGGNVTRGVLTVALADAELRHALETAGLGGGHRRSRRMSLLLSGLASLVVAAAVTWAIAVTPVGRPVAAGTEPVPTVITLSVPVGSLLNLVPAPSVVPAATASTPPPLPRVAPAPPPMVARPVPRSAPATAQPAAGPARSVAPPATLPAAATVSVVPVHPVSITPAPPSVLDLSAGDLIDLVLAAQRALQYDATRR